MSSLSSFDISTSGLIAQRERMNLIANNLANVNTTRDAQNRPIPFRRKIPIFAPEPTQGTNARGGVRILKIVDDDSAFRLVHDPDHPDAIRENVDIDGDGWIDTGYVRFPNVNPIVEMVDMITATRAYEANVTAMDATKSMHATSLRILA
ncbi:MAG: flagellar basal body rod protein FlgC [Planctomycetes bacterium]|nr:flagellar basal body rod protein FlgC [Planctomycetota bacterium]